MSFIFLNILLCLGLVVSAFVVDRKTNESHINGSIVNLILMLAIIFFSMALTIGLCLRGVKQFSLILGRVTFMFMGWFSVLSCEYLCLYPGRKRNGVLKLTRAVLFFIAFYIIFFVPNAFTTISVTKRNGLQIASGLVFRGSLSRVFPFSWLAFYNLIYRFAIPLFTCLMVLIRAEMNKSKLVRQNMIFAVLGMVFSWICFRYMNMIIVHNANVLTIIAIGYIPQLLMYNKANTNEEILDFPMLMRTIVKFILNYIIPIALLGGILFCLDSVFGAKQIYVLCALYFLSSLFVFIVLPRIFKNLTKHGFLRDKKYERNFERDLSSIKFDSSAQEVAGSIFSVFQKYLGTTEMKVYINSNNENLDLAYDSTNTSEASMPLDMGVIDVLLNNHRQVVFREYAEVSTQVTIIRKRLLDMFEKLNCDALILLNEGRSLAGIISLGKKSSGNIYNEYDYAMFNKYYSNLFVAGYFIKNIINENVVGTVNREIRMSGQIITSIQENMDIIKSSKVDIGYRMIPAHNIGGEFIDLIRLTETRHIFVIGALSGKGISASMGMVILKSIIRTFLTETKDFKLLVSKVNNFIRESLPKGTFFAGTFGMFDFATDTMYYINCGSPALFVYTRAYNNVIEVQGEGHVLGFVKDVLPYLTVKKVKLSPNDIVMSCTDGLIETRSLHGDVFGKERAYAGLLENSGFSADKMAQFTYESLIEFTSKELDNDITILIIKYLGK